MQVEGSLFLHVCYLDKNKTWSSVNVINVSKQQQKRNPGRENQNIYSTLLRNSRGHHNSLYIFWRGSGKGPRSETKAIWKITDKGWCYTIVLLFINSKFFVYTSKKNSKVQQTRKLANPLIWKLNINLQTVISMKIDIMEREEFKNFFKIIQFTAESQDELYSFVLFLV